MKKKNFQLNDYVRIVGVPNDNFNELNGMVCLVLGKAYIQVIDTYIIQLPQWIKTNDPDFPETRTICLTEGCLELET
jgi:hypothetical protein